MASASSGSDFGGFTLDNIDNINRNKSVLSSDKSDIDISEYLLDKEKFR